MLGAIFLWASSSSGNKLALTEASVPEVVLFRVLGAALVMWSIGLALRVDYKPRSNLPFVMGILEPGMTTFFIVLGLSMTSAVNGAVVWAIMPITQPFLAQVVLKEPLQRSVIVAAPVSVLGAMLLFWAKHQDGTGSLLGDFFLVCGVMSASVNQMLARKIATTYSEPIVTTSFQLLSATVMAILYFVVMTTSGIVTHTPYVGISVWMWPVMLYLIVTTAGPFFLYNYALQFLSVGRVSLFAPLTGPIGAVIATVVFAEPVTVLVLASLTLALGGAMLPTIMKSVAMSRGEDGVHGGGDNER
jgi:drug/metabolite transporter (DMT)-like permease